MDQTETEKYRETMMTKARRIAVLAGLQFERMDAWLAAAIAGGLLALTYVWLTTG